MSDLRAKALEAYIKEKHTQEECVGFSDGFEQGQKAERERIVRRLDVIRYNATTTEAYQQAIKMVNDE